MTAVVRICLTLFAFGLLPVPSSAEPAQLDGPPTEWLQANAPFGWDITFDGKIWVNTNPVGRRDDYAILGNDLHRAKTNASTSPRVWIRGYHARNPKVAYRETKILVSFDCERDTYWTVREIRYSASGESLGSLGPYSTEPIIPGSVAESWRDAVCPE